MFRQNATKIMMILVLVLVLAGCENQKYTVASVDGIADRFTTEAEKIAIFANGSPEGFWARDDRGNGGMFDCAFGKENARIEDGCLTLVLDRKGETWVGAEYRTAKKYGYGFYSVSMKAAKCSGVISSFFTYHGRPWDEIDIEFLGNDTTKVQFNYFVEGEGGHEYVYDLGFDAAEDFHEYAFEWQSDSITWYVDGKAVYKVTGKMPETAGNIMMNLWNTASYKADWAGAFDGNGIPVTAEYEWIGFSSDSNALK